jgi:predicted nucleic acid-binding protein
MEKGLVVCDTNIFIEFYKNNKQIVENLKKIGLENIAMSSITAGELIFGAFDKRELQNIRNDIDSLIVLPLNENISNKFIDLMTKYSLSHNLDVPDALIASSAIEYNCELYTLNQKHFKYIDELKLSDVQTDG